MLNAAMTAMLRTPGNRALEARGMGALGPLRTSDYSIFAALTISLARGPMCVVTRRK